MPVVLAVAAPSVGQHNCKEESLPKTVFVKWNLSFRKLGEGGGCDGEKRSPVEEINNLN